MKKSCSVPPVHVIKSLTSLRGGTRLTHGGHRISRGHGQTIGRRHVDVDTRGSSVGSGVRAMRHPSSADRWPVAVQEVSLRSHANERPCDTSPRRPLSLKGKFSRLFFRFDTVRCVNWGRSIDLGFVTRDGWCTPHLMSSAFKSADSWPRRCFCRRRLMEFGGGRRPIESATLFTGSQSA